MCYHCDSRLQNRKLWYSDAWRVWDAWRRIRTFTSYLQIVKSQKLSQCCLKPEKMQECGNKVKLALSESKIFDLQHFKNSFMHSCRFLLDQTCKAKENISCHIFFFFGNFFAHVSHVLRGWEIYISPSLFYAKNKNWFSLKIPKMNF